MIDENESIEDQTETDFKVNETTDNERVQSDMVP